MRQSAAPLHAARAACLALLLCAGLQPASARPWHVVNQFDLDGNVCPALTRNNQACPVVCVPSIDACPPKVMPRACPSGQFYCHDGSCRPGTSFDAACAATVSACLCNHGSYDPSIAQPANPEALFPCSLTHLVNVTNYHPGNAAGDKALVQSCAADLGLDKTAGTPRAPFVLQCKPKVFELTMFETEFVIFYGVVIMQASILFIYQIYRSLRAAGPGGFTADSAKQTTMFDDNQLEMQESIARSAKSSDLRFTGYRKDPLGTMVLASIVITSFFWFFLMSIIIADYYEVFSGYGSRDSTLLLGNHENLSRVFIILWHIMTIWFVTLQVNSSWLLTYFAVRAPLASASFVLIEKELASAVKFNNLGPIVERIQKIERQFLQMTKMDRALKTTSIKYTNNGRRYIEFECVRYVFDQTTGSFEPYKFTIGPKHSDLVRQSAGLSSSEAERRHELDGPNQIVFRVDTFAKGIIKEFTGIFYIYQLMMLLIWYYYAYYYMGIVLSVVIIGSGVVKVIVSTNAQKRVLEMATFRGTSRVLRDGTWTTVDCTELTPGDVIEIEASSSNQLSVDCVIVKGEVVADESSLTGEALPVAKFAIKNDDLTFRHDEAGKINSLFAGCYVLETRPDAPNEPVTAIVLSTGASTAKGRLVRDILYPMPVSFVFLEHLKIVLPMLAVWGVIMLILSIIMLGSADADAWFYGMFTISQVLSPLLPAVLVIGQSISSDRLRAQGIMCVDLSRITLAGKVKVFCFDKTGTLTKEGLDFIGAHPVQPTASPSSSSPAQFGMLDTNFASFPMVIKQAMHCCHSLSTVGGNHVGNFVDVEMFRATGATLDMRDHNAMVSPAVHSRADKLRTLKRFEFVHAKAYMSVIAQEVETGKITVFLKGSYERVRELVNPVSLPVDFDQVAKSHSSNGCYVLAVAKREIPAGVTAAEVVNWTRDQVEQGAVMAGLLLFRNELKPDTEAALNQLRRGGCRVVMITGDHINTGIHIARTCSMIRKDWQGQEPYVIIGDLDKLGQIAWTNTDDDSSLSRADVESLIARGRSGFREVEIAVTGKAFNALLKSGWMREYLHETRVFARMSPEDKVRCVRLHMEQSITAMCGDGGNDAGALKASHAGVALSEAQSSVVSHFSSRNRSIMSCVELLREARCSLDISFASYKYLIMYGEILAFLGLVQYYFVVNMSQALWILIDGSTVPVSWALTMARPARHLSDTRPTARLLGPETILSVVGQIVINIIFQVTVVVVLFRQRFFRCAEFDGASADMRRWWELADNFEGQATGLIGTFQILHAAAAFNIGSKYRTGFFSNRVFLAVYATVFAIISFIMLADPNPIGCMFHINCGTKEALQGIGYNVAFNTPVDYYAPAGHNVMSRDFRWILWLIAVLNLVAVTAWEGIVVLGAGRAWAKAKWPRRRDQMRV